MRLEFIHVSLLSDLGYQLMTKSNGLSDIIVENYLGVPIARTYG
jgi:hypothetical protein